MCDETPTSSWELHVVIPKIIHQTWKTHVVPENCRAWVETWKKRHPDWRYILWSDAELDAFVAEHYPDFLAIFRSYAAGVQRADAARYLLLHQFGGVYCDIDTECLAPFDVLCSESRIVFCEEPRSHWEHVVAPRGLSQLIFNGTIASPAGHAFWPYLMRALAKNHATPSVLDSTGPYILSGCLDSFPDQSSVSISSSHLFCGLEVQCSRPPDQRSGDHGGRNLSLHHWQGSWYSKEKYPLLDKLESHVRAWIYLARRGRQYQPKIDTRALHAPLPEVTGKEEVAVLIPVRDAASYIDRCLELLLQLDWPRDRLHVVFCEGDSKDDTVARLTRLTAENALGFGSFRLLRKHVGTRFERDRRWLASIQKSRRGGLARVRNHLIDEGLPAQAQWALWVDADVNNYPPNILRRLLAERAKIVVPHCLRDNGTDKTFDLNSFSTVYYWRDTYYLKHVIDGLFQPPQDCGRRIHLQDVRYLQRLPLNGVGGTMLLVQADVHRAGLRFPDWPYKDLIETEGFGQLARDHGLVPIGLPNVEITHPA